MNKHKIIISLFVFLVILLLPNCAIKKRIEATPMPTHIEKPPELLWQDATRFLRNKNYTEAASTFEEIDKQHPYSKLAKQGQVMSAYTYYISSDYNNSLYAIDRFIALYPADKKTIPYMLYLKGLCYYEQINDVNLDQEPSRNARNAYEELIKKYPNSKYNKDVKKKMLLVEDQLAAQEMNIGRFYQKKNSHLAAIQRFQVVIKDYNTTAQTPEALYRLTESYLSLGILEEAKKTTSLLSYNYKKSNWYKLSYELIKKYGYKKNGKKS